MEKQKSNSSKLRVEASVARPHEIEKSAVNAIRVLGVETISHAKSGHSGIVLGAAPIVYSTYKAMKVDPENPSWFNRDRFVMSAGHGSALLYATLHMFGFPISTEQLKTFRKLGSPLHGHPEVDESKGIDASTGPLGQGVAMGVGLALAERRLSAMLASQNNEKDAGMSRIPPVDHHTYILAGDGCLMEGISYEACNLAGLWKLNKLIMLYDSNQITLDGARTIADGECVEKRFRAMNWDVLNVADGNDTTQIDAAIEKAKCSAEKPTLIIVNTQIGYGSSTAGTHKAHGQVLCSDEAMGLRKRWGIGGAAFEFNAEIKNHFAKLIKSKKGLSKKWAEGAKENKLLEYFVRRKINEQTIIPKGEKMSIRDAGQLALSQVFSQNPRLWGGSADVASTTKAFIDEKIPIHCYNIFQFSKPGFFSHENPLGSDIAFGVREFAMAAICNGLALHGFMPYCSTFLAFSDYARSAIRLSALMNLPVHYVFSHDGIGNPPDGPTHQATEHIASLRLIPNMMVFRPADDVEVAATYKWVYESAKPATTILSRGGESDEFAKINAQFPIVERMKAVAKGGYVLSQTVAREKVILLATGSEVSLALQVQRVLGGQGIGSKVVSMPCTHLFDRQPSEYKEEVLGCGDVPIVAIEMGSGVGWYKYVGLRGEVVSFDDFGASGSDVEVRDMLGFTVDRVVGRVCHMLKHKI